MQGPHTQTERFYVDTHGPDDGALRLAWRWLLDQAQTHRGGSIYVPQLSNVENLTGGLGGATARALKKDRRVRVAPGVTIELSTDRSHNAGQVPLLAAWPSADDLDRIDDETRPALCVVPWNREELAYWVAGHQPIDLATTVRAGTRDLDISTLVTVGVGSLPPWGIAGSTDRARAIETLRLLHESGERLHPDEVRSLALRQGLRAQHAAQLASIAGELNAGHSFRIRHSGLRADILDAWREQADNSESGTP